VKGFIFNYATIILTWIFYATVSVVANITVEVHMVVNVEVNLVMSAAAWGLVA